MPKPWVLTEEDYLSDQEVQAFRRALREADAAADNPSDGHIRWLPIRDWAIFDLALGTGLRVTELCDLNCGDLRMSRGQRSVIVRSGKGGKKRAIPISIKLKRHLKRYLHRKRKHGEKSGERNPLFCGQRNSRISRYSCHRRFKHWAKRAGLPPGYSMHSLRHTYATHLLRLSKNMRLVQKMLGHRSVSTTQVYADVMPEEAEKAVDGLYAEKGKTTVARSQRAGGKTHGTNEHGR